MTNYSASIAVVKLENNSLIGRAWLQVSNGTTTPSYGYYLRDGYDYVFGNLGKRKAGIGGQPLEKF